jgi:hypothetical protein
MARTSAPASMHVVTLTPFGSVLSEQVDVDVPVNNRKNGAARPPGTSSVAMILSRVDHTSDIHSNTTPAIQPMSHRSPQTRRRTIARGSDQLGLPRVIPKRSRASLAMSSGSPTRSSAFRTAASPASEGSSASMSAMCSSISENDLSPPLRWEITEGAIQIVQVCLHISIVR